MSRQNAKFLQSHNAKNQRAIVKNICYIFMSICGKIVPKTEVNLFMLKIHRHLDLYN